jgi:dTDP-glucose pyrophosphorylase
MNFLITMAGEGTRFRNSGYRVPKMLIEVRGKTLMEWSVESLPLEICTQLIFVILQQDEDNFSVSTVINELYGGGSFNLTFTYLPSITRGQAESALIAAASLDSDEPLLIYNIDTMFRSKTLKKSLLRKDVDGVIGCFYATDPRYSYARLDNEGYVIETAEKRVISDLALTGLYHFNHAGDFVDVAKFAIEQNRRVNNEFYIAPLYNDLIARGRRFIVDPVLEIHVLGTPEELQIFERG